MKASDRLKGFTKSKEKFMPEVYDDFTGKPPVNGKFIGTPTQGYGDTAGITPGPISEEEATRRLNDRFAIAEQELGSAITRKDLSQGKMDALIDMHYNMGMGEIKNIIDLVNAGRDDEVAKAIPLYNKAKNKKTGKMEVLPGLVTRAEERVAMWNGQEDQQAPSAPIGPSVKKFDVNDEASLNAAIADFERAQGQAQMINEDRNLDAAIADFEAKENAEAPGLVEANQLKISSDAADPADVLRVNEANLVAKETGAPFETVLGMMTEGYTQKQIRAKANIGDLARHYPSTTKWAKDPANFAVMEETGNWAKEVEATTRDLISNSDVAKAYDTGLLTLSEVATSLGAALGRLTPEEVEERYTAIANEKQKRAVENQDLKDLRKVWAQYISEGGSLFDTIAYTAERPGALGLQSIESAVTSAIPFTSSMIGVLAPPTLPYAVGGAFLSGGAIAAGSRFKESLDSYVDPKTGQKGTMQQALRDKDFMQRARVEMSIYGGVMGTFDAAFGLTAGKFFPKLAAKGAAGKVAGGALEVAAGPASEAGSELFATSAADAYTGKLTSKKWKENKRAAAIEGVMSIPVEGSFGPIAYGARKAAPMAKIKAHKTIELATDGVKAIKDTAALSQLREKMKRVGPTYPGQAKELVKQSLTPFQKLPPIPGADPDYDAANAFENYRAKALSDVKAMSADADSGVVRIAPSEWIEHFEAKGLDPYTMIQGLGADVHEIFMKNIESDSSVTIPIEDWVSLVIEDEELDLIARVGGNKYNGEEASTLMEAMDENPGLLYRDDELPSIPDEDLPPPIPGDANPMTIIEATQAEGNAVLRPVDLVGKFNNDEEKQVFGGLKRKLQKLGKDLKLEKDAVEAFADIQFGRLKHRAEVTGRPINEIYNNLALRTYDNPEATHKGFFDSNHVEGEEGKTKLSFNKGRMNHIDTVIHEFGHSWLHEMAQDFQYINNLKPESMTVDQEEYKFAMDKLAEIMGLKTVEDLLTMDKKAYQRVHESFAQTTELYFLEGKYENNKVRAVMESFRRWIVDTIRYIKTMAAKYPTIALSPEVERMFEGILGTSNKIEEKVIPMFTPPMFTDEFLGAEAETYKNALADAQTEAVGETYFKSFQRSLKDREKLIRTELKRIQAEAVEDVDKLPSMRLMNNMNEMYKQFKAGTLELDPRFSYESVQEELLDGNEAETAWLKSQLPSSMMTGKKKGGVDVREFMYQNNIWAPSEVLHMLIETTKRDALIEARVQEKIVNEFPVMKSDEEIHDIAVEAVNGAGKEKLLLLEMQILAEKALPKLNKMAAKLMQPPVTLESLTKIQLSFEAFEIVADANAIKFSADKYLRDSQRMAREASKAFRQNDIVDAFNRKRREAVSFLAYRQAQTAQKALAQSRHLARMILKYAPSREAMSRMDTDVLKYGYQVLIAMDKSNPVPKFEDITLSKYSGVTESHIERLDTARKDLIEAMQSRTGANISVEGEMALGELLKAILFVSRQAKEVEMDGKKTSLAEASTALVTGIDPEGPVVSYEMDHWFSASRRRVSNQKVATGFASLYPDQATYAASPLGVLMGAIREGEAKVGLDMADAETRLYDAFKDIVKSGPKKTKKETLLAPLKRLSETPPVNAPELKFNFNSEGDMLMALATALGSESGATRFLTSLNPTTGEPIGSINVLTGKADRTQLDLFVNRMIDEGKLRKEHFQLLNTMWAIFEGHFPGVKDTMRQTDGIEMGKIAASPFKNKFGEWTGGYVPVAQAQEVDAAMVRAGLLTVDSNGYNASHLYPMQATGLSKKRNKVSSAALDLDMRKLLSYVATASKIQHLRKPMLDFGKIMKRPDVAARIQQRRPDFLKNVVSPWFDYVVDQIYTDPDRHIAHTIFGKLRKNANTVMYLGSLMTPYRQFYGLIPAAQRVGAKEMRASLVRMGGINNAKMIMGQARDKSVFMRERAQGSLKKFVKTHDVLETNFDWFSTAGDMKDKMTYVLTQAAQNIVDAATWDAGYNGAISKGLTEKVAIRLADAAVADSQGSPNVSDMSAIQRGNNFERLITMVTSVPIAMNNMIAEEMMRTDSGKEKFKIAVGMGSVLLALPFILESGVSGDDDEEKDLPEHLTVMATKVTAGFLDAGFPVISRPLTGYLTYDNPSISPALSKLTNSARVPTIVKNSVQGVDMSAKEAALLLETFTLFSGIPTSIGGRVIRFVDKQKSKPERKRETRRRRRQLSVARRN